MNNWPANKVEMRNVSELVPYANNSRTHSPQQVDQIAASINEWGWTMPVLIDEKGMLIAGHGRIMAAQKLGIEQVPTMTATGWTEAQKKAYVIADNKLALNADWNDELLALELQELQELDFDLELTGFDEDELASITPLELEAGLTDEDAVPELQDEPVTKLGDVWVLGKHRVMCGDSTSIDAVEKLMAGQKADMVFTDPPYGISIVGKTGKVGSDNLAKNGVYAEVAGDGSIDVAVEAIHLIQTLSPQVQIIWGGNYYSAHLPNSSCWIVWDKENTGNFADAELAWTNQKTAVRIFKHMWNGMVKASERGEKRVHPTQKPVALAEWCIKSYGEDCDSVLDLFGGSGFTLIACEKLEKTALLMELSPDYCDVIIRRWQEFTGKEAVLESSGQKFEELEGGDDR